MEEISVSSLAVTVVSTVLEKYICDLSQLELLLGPQFKLIYSTTDSMLGWFGVNNALLLFRDVCLFFLLDF